MYQLHAASLGLSPLPTPAHAWRGPWAAPGRGKLMTGPCELSNQALAMSTVAAAGVGILVGSQRRGGSSSSTSRPSRCRGPGSDRHVDGGATALKAKQRAGRGDLKGLKKSPVDGLNKLDLSQGVADDAFDDPAEAQLWQQRQMQLNTLNAMIKTKNNGSRKKEPGIGLGPAADNPWTDRYLLCGDCERRATYKEQGPRPRCNMSTLLEVDMTAPFSRDNVMATSCELVQMIREDIWIQNNPDNKAASFFRVHPKSKGSAGTYPVQVCNVCRKTSLEEDRKFTTCNICKGCHYCSAECLAKDRLKHRASCHQPVLPYREEWGVRKALRKMRDEIYPCIGMFAITPLKKHLIAWTQTAPKTLGNPDPSRDLLSEDADSATRALVVSCPTIGGEIKKFETKRPQNRDLACGAAYLGPSSATDQVGPDDVALLSLGMTREEWEEKNNSSLVFSRTRALQFELEQERAQAFSTSRSALEFKRMTPGVTEEELREWLGDHAENIVEDDGIMMEGFGKAKIRFKTEEEAQRCRMDKHLRRMGRRTVEVYTSIPWNMQIMGKTIEDMPGALRPPEETPSRYSKGGLPFPKGNMVSLEKEAVERVELAATNAAADSKKPPWLKKRPAPWEEEVEKRKKKKEDVIDVNYEGVIYKDSMAKKLAKKHGLQLSSDALERLEEAADLGKASEKDKDFPTQPVDKEKKDRLVLGQGKRGRS